MRRLITLCLYLIFFTNALAQAPYLKPSIGIGSLPPDTTPICTIPFYFGSFDTSGYVVGDTVADFTLYTVNGSAVSLHALLGQHKPLLLLSGSYTCSEFRQQVADMDSMAAFYQGLLNICVVYTLEAHPDNTYSAYLGYLDVGPANVQANILYPQPATYGQRVKMVDTLNAHLNVNSIILVDGPCNEWWSHFGPAPNNAHLIDTNGIVRAKNGWFDQEPVSMWCSIDSLLGTNSGHCFLPAPDAHFSFHLTQDSVVTGMAGQTLEIHGMLKNLSTTHAVALGMLKNYIAIPAGWQTALCTDLCYPPQVDTAVVAIAPADSQQFTFYFYTDSIPASGSALITFRNMADSTNIVRQHVYANTHAIATGLSTTLNPTEVLQLYPNPTDAEQVFASFPFSKQVSAELADISGKLIRKLHFEGCDRAAIPTDELKVGIYFLKLHGDSWSKTIKLVKE